MAKEILNLGSVGKASAPVSKVVHCGMSKLKQFIKTQTIELVETRRNGDKLVQNTGDSSDQWIIPKDVFESTYKRVK